MTAAQLQVGDHVRVRDWDEGVGIVRQVDPGTGSVWVETSCNTWRNYPSELFVRVDEELTPGVNSL